MVQDCAYMAKRSTSLGSVTAPLLAVLLAAAFGLAEPACSSGSSRNGFGGDDDAAARDGTAGDDGGGDGPTFGGDGDTSMLRIQPANPTVDVTIADGVVSAPPLAMIAQTNGGATQVTASWALDRGELGT